MGHPPDHTPHQSHLQLQVSDEIEKPTTGSDPPLYQRSHRVEPVQTERLLLVSSAIGDADLKAALVFHNFHFKIGTVLVQAASTKTSALARHHAVAIHQFDLFAAKVRIERDGGWLNDGDSWAEEASTELLKALHDRCLWLPAST
eukprot:TRINITY_DN3976_c0_g1_i1.p1 TRINITY_DN3976_c0_g1~~TRINITY_DN3976_c0_g1_i1.p1  ORF type:complete len:145 (-),score=9.58 TRINITY_DN3976_c0_g1_i1:140-574(-)